VNLSNAMSSKRPASPPLHLARDTAEPTRLPRESNGAARGATAQVLLKPSSGRERRRAVRYACKLQTACVVISLTDPLLLKVKVRDLSQTGIGLVLGNRLPPGTFLAVKLQGPGQPQPRVVRAQVMHSTVLTGDKRTWIMGCSFVGALSQDDIKMLI
jgi:PilZ domain